MRASETRPAIKPLVHHSRSKGMTGEPKREQKRINKTQQCLREWVQLAGACGPPQAPEERESHDGDDPNVLWQPEETVRDKFIWI